MYCTVAIGGRATGGADASSSTFSYKNSSSSAAPAAPAAFSCSKKCSRRRSHKSSCGNSRAWQKQYCGRMSDVSGVSEDTLDILDTDTHLTVSGCVRSVRCVRGHMSKVSEGVRGHMSKVSEDMCPICPNVRPGLRWYREDRVSKARSPFGRNVFLELFEQASRRRAPPS